MNVLSLFDGMSCGRIALERAGIPVENYYASEIDKHAIKVSGANYPDIIQLGSVTELINIDWSQQKIDLLIGGSPCQGFSSAGKQLNFDDPRSKLFFEYVRVLNEIRKVNPHVKFLLENVKMKKEYQKVIPEHLGVEPIEVNSDLVSAQSRKRVYWTNIEGFTMPEDKGILLENIIQSGKVDRPKSLCLTHRYCGFQGSQDYLRRRYFGKSMGQAVFENAFIEEQKKYWKSEPYGKEEIPGTVRRLTPLECERLQNVPEGYTNIEGITENKKIEILGNGWTVDVIVEFFKHLKPTADFNENLDF